MDAAYFLVSLLNGLSVGLLLFMLASGLTLIFSMMGVLNFAHASFYMLGAYVGFSITRVADFWWALVLAPLLVGAIGAGFERFVLRRVYPSGHVAELLVTFGFGYVVLEIVQLIWGRQALDFRPPELLRRALFTIVELPSSLSLAWGAPPPACREVAGALCTQFPQFRAFAMAVTLLTLLALWGLLKGTRIGLVVQASLTHPEMTQALGHNVPRVRMAVFAGGTALAALAGVMGGALRVTEPSMALSVGAVVFAVIVIGGLGSLTGAFVACVLLGVLESFAVGSDRSLADLMLGLGLQVSGRGVALWNVRLSQLAALLPFGLLVLVLIFRPRGLLGKREA